MTSLAQRHELGVLMDYLVAHEPQAVAWAAGLFEGEVPDREAAFAYEVRLPAIRSEAALRASPKGWKTRRAALS